MSGAEFVSLAISLCQMAVKSGSKIMEQYKKKKLSEIQKELLIAAANEGEFYILSADGVPDWLRVANKNFVGTETNDPAIAIKYTEAFKDLCERGYIYHDSGILFRLTSAGFEKARKLATQ